MHFTQNSGVYITTNSKSSYQQEKPNTLIYKQTTGLIYMFEVDYYRLRSILG